MADYNGISCDTCKASGKFSLDAERLIIPVEGSLYQIDICSDPSDLVGNGLRMALQSAKEFGQRIPGGIYTGDNMSTEPPKEPEGYLDAIPVPEWCQPSLDPPAPPVAPPVRPPVPPTPATTEVGREAPEKEEAEKKEKEGGEKEGEDSAPATLFEFIDRLKRDKGLTLKGLNAELKMSEDDYSWFYTIKNGGRVGKDRVRKIAKGANVPIETLRRLYIAGRNYHLYPAGGQEFLPDADKEGELETPIQDQLPEIEGKEGGGTPPPRKAAYLNDRREEERLDLSALRYRCQVPIAGEGILSIYCNKIRDSANRAAHAMDHGKESPWDIPWKIQGLPEGWKLYSCEYCEGLLPTKRAVQNHKRHCPRKPIDLAGMTLYLPRTPRPVKPTDRSEFQKKAIFGNGQTRGINPRI